MSMVNLGQPLETDRSRRARCWRLRVARGRAHVEHVLVREQLPDAVGRDDGEVVRVAEVVGRDLRGAVAGKHKARARSTPEARLGRRDAADVLGDLVPEGPREGAARPEGVGEPDARRVALLVELRAEVALPDLGDGAAQTTLGGIPAKGKRCLASRSRDVLRFGALTWASRRLSHLF